MTVTCDRVGLDYFESAPIIHRASEEIAATPDVVFAVFLDGEAWTRWVFAITGVEWTSPLPLQVGSTRSVHMLGGLVGYEEFIAFDHGKRMAFRFNEVSKGSIVAFAEDYQVTDLGNGRCRVDWTMAMSLGRGEPGLTDRILHPVMGAFIKRTLRKFRRYVESQVPRRPRS